VALRLLSLILVLALGSCTARPLKQPAEMPSDSQQQQTTARVSTPLPASVTPGGHSASRAAAPRATGTRLTPQREPRIDEVYRADARPEAAPPAPSGPADITLNFQAADVREVARFILGELLGRNYFVDAGVAGTVTLATAKPMRRADLLPTLEAVLKSIGAKLVTYQGVYRVMRDTGVPGRDGGEIATADRAAGAPSFVVFPMEFIAAEEMAKILTPMLPERAIAHADPVRNVIVVAGDSTTQQLAGDAVAIFDVDQMRGKHVLLLGLQNADARTVVKEVESIFGASGRTPAARISTEFIPVDRLNAVMVLSRNFDHIEEARNWVYRLDRNLNPTERRLFVYYVQHGQAQSLAAALREIVGTVDGGAEAAPAQAGANNALPANPAGETTRPGALAGVARDLTIAVDGERNALLISAVPTQFRLVEDVLTQLDIPPLQVMIEASIFEVSLRDSLRYGIQYALSNGGLGLTENGLASISRGTTTATGAAASIIEPVIAPILPGFNFTLNGTSRTRLIVDALSELTEINMISSPNILVVNNKVAQLKVGDEVPIITQSTTSAVTDNPLIVNTVQYRSTGVNLEVTPRINASGMVSLDIVQEVSDVARTTTSNIDSPTIQNRSLLSTVTMESGETVMIGGLIRERAEDGKSGIPLLHDLPVVGALFGSTSQATARTELVVLIRPIIVESPEDARVVTASLKDKFLTLMQRERIGIRQPRRMLKGDAL
jgi:general secretion pathway protein D